MRILGISAFYHDSAAALIVDGRIVAAAQEERFTRKKSMPTFPRHAIDYCLKAGRLSRSRTSITSPSTTSRFSSSSACSRPISPSPARVHLVPHGDAAVAEGEAVSEIAAADELKALEPEFRLGQAAALLRASPEPRGVGVLSLAVRARRRCSRMDGVGEWATTSAAVGDGNELEIQQGDPLSAFAWAALFGVHLLHRLQGQFRRVQGDGACALWQARNTHS